MERVELDGVVVEYELTGSRVPPLPGGSGSPVVLPHARPFVLWYQPLVERLGDHAVLWYRREPPLDPAPGGRIRPFGVDDDAGVCARLLAHLGLGPAHVVGHSYGGLVALALARAHPSAVRSLALLEPATIGLVPPDEAARRAAPLLGAAAADGPEAAMDLFLRAVCGPDAPEVLDRLVPGAYADAVAHAAGFFGVELPAAVRWSFAASDAERVDAPVLHLRGADSPARFAEGAALLEAWFPAAAHHVLPGTTHFLMAQTPDPTADLLQRFWADH